MYIDKASEYEFDAAGAGDVSTELTEPPATPQEQVNIRAPHKRHSSG